jgi:hypothetical protein
MSNRINVFTFDDEGNRRLAGTFYADKATKVEGRQEWDGNNNADVHIGANRGQNLYRTAQGHYVLEQWSNYQTEETTHRFVDDDEARAWLLVNQDDALVEQWFGEIEETGPGRPAVGSPTPVRLGDELTRKVDAARQGGESRAAAIRRLLEAALS